MSRSLSSHNHPQASTLRMEGGAHADVAALIADVERGLYVG